MSLEEPTVISKQEAKKEEDKPPLSGDGMKAQNKVKINVVTWNINKGSTDKTKAGSQDENTGEKAENESRTDTEDEVNEGSVGVNDAIEGSGDIKGSNGATKGPGNIKGSKGATEESKPPSNTGPTKGSTGFGETRNLFTEAFAKAYPSVFYCIQEPQVKQPKGLPNFKHTYNNKKDGAIASPDEIEDNKKKFKITYQDPPEGQPSDHNHDTRSKNGARPQEITWPGYNDEKRFYCRKIKIEDDKRKPLHKFMLVSYHAEYKGGSIQKLKKFFQDMQKMANDHEIPIIVGADFNIDVKKWREEVVSKQVKIPETYPLSPRRKGKDIIDTIAVIHPDQPNSDIPTTCEIKKIRAVEFERISSNDNSPWNGPRIEMAKLEEIHRKHMATWEEKKAEVKEEKALRPPTADELFDMMDHDPVIAEIELS